MKHIAEKEWVNMRCLERTRVDFLKEDYKFKELVSRINDSKYLGYNLELVGDGVHLYRKGILFAEKIRNNKYGQLICNISEYANYPNKKQDNVLVLSLLEKWDDYAKNHEEYFKQETNRNENDEKEFQFRLAKTLSMSVASSSVFSIIPEYIQKKGDPYRIDLVVLEKGQENERPHLVLVEVKRGSGSLSDDSGIKDHLKTYTEFLSSSIMCKTLICDSELVFMQKAELGIIPNINPKQAIDLTDIDYSKTTILFVLADIEKEDRVLTRECVTIDWNQYCGFPIEFAFVKSSDCDFANYKKESIVEFSKRWKAN